MSSNDNDAYILVCLNFLIRPSRKDKEYRECRQAPLKGEERLHSDKRSESSMVKDLDTAWVICMDADGYRYNVRV
jgi:hypothetical protein